MSCEFKIIGHDEIRSRLIEKLRCSDEVLTYEQEPALASLCTSMALKFELERPVLDRLSPFWGVDPNCCQPSPYQVDIIMSHHLGFGLVINASTSQKLLPRSLELRTILHPDSVDESGCLSRILVFPALVAQHYRNSGFELVIVRDWILRTALSDDSDGALNYLVANEWELDSIICKMQLRLMLNRQLPFFGTHDIVDHLFGADLGGYLQSCDYVRRSHELINERFSDPEHMTRQQKVLVYLLGVVLDDLAQPKWYGSKTHFMAVDQILTMLKDGVESDQVVSADLLRPSWIEGFVTKFRTS